MRSKPPLLRTKPNGVTRLLGAWLIHIVLVLCGKMVLDTVPGMTQELSWTLTNLLYLGVSTQPKVRALPLIKRFR